MINAVVFVLSQHLLPDADRCIQYCLGHGYAMVGLIKDDWGAAITMLIDGKASVVVAASPDHVPADRTPRVEYVCHAAPPAGRARTVRTSRINRSGAAA